MRHLAVLLPLADHWILHPLRGLGYQFFSGIEAAAEGALSVAFFAIVFLRRHNCHVRRCWRLGRHGVLGTSYYVCSKHHPEIPQGGPSAARVAEARTEARDRSAP